MFSTSDSSKSIFEHARKVFDINPSQHRAANRSVGGLFNQPLWLGDNLLLAKSHCPNGSIDTAYRIDLKTQRLVISPRLTKLLNDIRGGWSLSPDRQWVLWYDGWSSKSPQIVATRVDTRHSLHWAMEGKEEDQTSGFWLPNSTCWMRFLLGEEGESIVGVRVYDLKHPHWSKRISFRFPVIDKASLLGVLADGTLLLSDLESDDFSIRERRTFTLIALHLDNGHPRVQTFRIKLPEPGVIRSLCPTPEGKQLAWLIDQGHATPGGGYSAKQAALFVSDLMGRNARSFGVLPFRYKSDDDSYLHGWFPDAKRVLLEARQQLFAIPLSAR